LFIFGETCPRHAILFDRVQKTFNLGKHGYRAYKYVPYGEVEEVMQYLLRRARENSAIVGGANQELSMIGAELKRRFQIA
jgi:proline dehydrogenase